MTTQVTQRGRGRSRESADVRVSSVRQLTRPHVPMSGSSEKAYFCAAPYAANGGDVNSTSLS
jgi:hypothetical protein